MTTADLTLEMLAARAADGDRRSLRALYERTAARLVREVIGPILVQPAACEDALRDTFVVALEKLPALAQGEIFPWLATIARNKALDRRRRMASESRFLSLLADELTHAHSADPESEAAAAQLREQARARIDDVLARMNPRYARALRLRLLDDRTREECAADFAIAVGTFDVVFFRACKQFRALYGDTYGARVEEFR